MNLQTSLNILQNRDWNLAYSCASCYIYSTDNQYLIVPPKSVGRVPSGTIDAMFRSAYTTKETACRTDCPDSAAVSTLAIILEKQANQFWGRIEETNLLAIATGQTPELVAKKLNGQLTEFKALASKKRGVQPRLPEDFVFTYQYDITRVRELFQQFRISALAEQANISQELLSQFMTSKQHPSYQQAQQLEELIQQFGREMLSFSLL